MENREGGEDFTAPFEKDDSPDRQARHVTWKDGGQGSAAQHNFTTFISLPDSGT